MVAFRVPGPVDVKVGSLAVGSAISIGSLKEGVIIRPQMIWEPVLADEGGQAPLDYIFRGRVAIVELIGLSYADIELAKLWPGGLLTKSHSDTNFPIGKVIDSTINNFALHLLEHALATEDQTELTWTAPIAIPLEPDELNLTATNESQVPVRFRILQNAAGQLFSDIPTYVGGAAT